MRRYVLIVEDDESIAEGVQARLNVEGYKTRIAPDGESAVEQARKEPPDVILLDIMLPKISGLDVCKILRGDPKTKNIPILVLTALDQIKDSETAFEVGATDYLTKPFETSRLLAKVKKLLGE